MHFVININLKIVINFKNDIFLNHLLSLFIDTNLEIKTVLLLCDADYCLCHSDCDTSSCWYSFGV